MEKQILNLLAKHNFEQLNAVERSLVLSETTEENYRAERKAILTAKHVMKEEAAKLSASPFVYPTEVKSIKKQPIILGLFNHRVPTWLAAAACILVFFLLKNADRLQFDDTTFEIAAVDTVYITSTIERNAYVKSANQFEKPLKWTNNYAVNKDELNATITITPKAVEPLVTENSFKDEMFTIDQMDYSQIISVLSQPKGTSAKDDTLAQLFGNALN